MSIQLTLYMQGAAIPIGDTPTPTHPQRFDFDTRDGLVALGSVSRIATTATAVIPHAYAKPRIETIGDDVERVTLSGELAVTNWITNADAADRLRSPFYPLEIWRQHRRKVILSSGLGYWAYAGNDWTIKSISEDVPDLYIRAPLSIEWTITLER